MLFYPHRERFPGHSDHPQRNRIRTGFPRFARKSNPHLERSLRGKIVEAQCGEEANDRIRKAASHYGEIVPLRQFPPRQRVQPPPDTLQLATRSEATQVSPGQIPVDQIV